MISKISKIMRKGIVITVLFLIVVLTAGGLAGSAFAAHPNSGEHPLGGGIPEGPQKGFELLAIVDAIVDWLFVLLLVHRNLLKTYNLA